METLLNVCDWIQPNPFFIGLDLHDAFLHTPINPESKKYLRFKWLGEILGWKVLPFGLICSLHAITEVLKSIIALIRSMWGILISIYIGDVLIQNKDKYMLHALLVVLVINSLGLGFLFDTVNMTISCPPGKVTKLQQLCSKLLNGKCTVLSLFPLPNFQSILIMESNEDLPYLNILVDVHLKA